MFVKDALEKEVGIVVELCGAVWRNFQPRECETKCKVNVKANEPNQNTK